MNRPELSVVISAADSWAGAIRFASALADHLGSGQVEAIVALPTKRPRSHDDPPVGVHWVEGEPGARVARLRWLGLQRASGENVVFVEDSCVPCAGWAEAWLDGLRGAGCDVATGCVGTSGSFQLLGLAMLLFEYGPTLAPLPSRVARLAGNNFGASRRFALELGGGRGEIHEAQWIAPALERGGRVRLIPGAQVNYLPMSTLGQALSNRIRCGLESGHERARWTSPWVRPLLLPVAPLIWVRKMVELRLSLAEQPGHRCAWRIALAPLGMLVAAWSLGAWLGWLTGRLVASHALDVEHRPDRAREALDRRVRDDAIVHPGQPTSKVRRVRGVLHVGRDFDPPASE